VRDNFVQIVYPQKMTGPRKDVQSHYPQELFRIYTGLWDLIGFPLPY